MPRFLKSRRVKRWLLAVLPLAALGAVCGCRTLGYYRQAIAGECGIITSERPIDKVLADPATPEPIREKLRLVEQLRAFAKSDLNLPVDGRYRCYADLHRPYVVWNVQAAPQFSLEPRTWWYPFVGSLEYRGSFSEHAAHDYALVFARQGDDVYVDGVEAYSTLGWFKDPVLNTFLADSEPELAETLFHELGHARVFALATPISTRPTPPPSARKARGAGCVPRATASCSNVMPPRSAAMINSCISSARRGIA